MMRFVFFALAGLCLGLGALCIVTPDSVIRFREQTGGVRLRDDGRIGPVLGTRLQGVSLLLAAVGTAFIGTQV
jgi:hypothetical protein